MRISDIVKLETAPVKPTKLVTVHLPVDIVNKVKEIRQAVRKPNAAVYEALIREGLDGYKKATGAQKAATKAVAPKAPKKAPKKVAKKAAPKKTVIKKAFPKKVAPGKSVAKLAPDKAASK